MDQIQRDPVKVPGDLRDKTRPASQDLKRQACDTCKRRKVRCSGANPCQNCERSGISCRYDSPHGKLSIAERRVTRYEQRIRLIETAWQHFLPEVELSYALHAVVSQQLPAGSRDGYGIHDSSSRPKGSFAHMERDVPRVFDPELDDTDLSPSLELEVQRADALEWDESASLAAISDGIGSLSIDAKGTGYMGPQSGNALLRYLQTISTFLKTPEDDLDLYRLQTPGSDVPEDVSISALFSEACVEWYFKYFHTAYPILHEGYFRAQLMGALPKPKDGSWPVLLNTVLAIGAFAGESSKQKADFHYCRLACESLTVDVMQRGSLSLVQAVALLANYLQKRNKPNSGFTLLGVALNMAQGLGLHREFSDTAVSAFTMEIRRRVWWTLFIFDSGARLTFGRPTMTLGGVNAHLPRNLGDKDLAVDIEELPQARETPTVASSLIWQSKLARLSNIANEKMLEAKSPDRHAMHELNNKITAWQEGLPVYLQADYSDCQFEMFDIPRMVLLWRSLHLRIVICRPFILEIIGGRKPLDLSDANELPNKGAHAAQECILSIISFWNNTRSRPGALVWYACYWSVTAVFVVVTCLLYDPFHDSAAMWRQLIENSQSVLEQMGKSEPLALRAAHILRKMLELVPGSPDSTTFVTNEPVRLGVADLWSQSWIETPLPDEDLPLIFSSTTPGFFQSAHY